MDDLFLALFLVSGVLVVLGMIKPKMVIRKQHKQNRKTVIMRYGVIMIISLIMFSKTYKEAPVTTEKGDSPTPIDVTEDITERKIENEVPVEPKRPLEHDNALRSAQNYLKLTNFSKEGLYDQLIYEGYPDDAAQYAVDTVDADWFDNALGSAEQYLDLTSFSRSGLYDQLLFEGYTEDQAQYAVDAIFN